MGHKANSRRKSSGIRESAVGTCATRRCAKGRGGIDRSCWRAASRDSVGVSRSRGREEVDSAMTNLTDPIFTDETKAREHFEAIRWPDGPYCPHCGETERVYRLNGKSHRPGLLHCNACDEAFTV